MEEENWKNWDKPLEEIVEKFLNNIDENEVKENTFPFNEITKKLAPGTSKRIKKTLKRMKEETKKMEKLRKKIKKQREKQNKK